MLDVIQGMIDQFRAQLASNEFLVGMLMTTMLGAGAFLLRSVPRRVGGLFFRLATIEVTFRSDDFGFDMANEFVLKKILVDRFSRVFLLTFRHMEGDGDRARGFQPGYGLHFGWYQRRPVLVRRTVDRESNAREFKEEVRLTFFTRRRSVLNGLADATKVYMGEVQNADRMRLYTSSGTYWSEHARTIRRSPDSVFLPSATKESVFGHLDRFLASEDLYLHRGIPWHTGLFFSGPPGSGKSSLIHALASHYRRSICYLNLGSVGGDAGLMALLARRWTDALLVIEDIDVSGRRDLATEHPRRRRAAAAPSATGLEPAPPVEDEPTGVSVSSLLNTLDGLLTPHGLIVVATANRPEMLDDAMLRRGRFDMRVELGLMQWPEFEAMALHFGHAPAAVSALQCGYVPIPAVEACNMLLAETGLNYP